MSIAGGILRSGYIRPVTYSPQDQSELDDQTYGFPILDDKALYGPAGLIARAGFYTSVEPAALIASFLTCAGSHFTRTSLRMEGESHSPQLFSVLVGSRLIRKAAFDHARKFFAVSDGATESIPSRSRAAKRKNTSTPLNVESWELQQCDDFLDAIAARSDGNEQGLRVVQNDAEDTDEIGSKLISVTDFQSTLLATRHRNQLASMMCAAWDNEGAKLFTHRQKRISISKTNVCLLGQISLEDLRAAMPTDSRLSGLTSRILWVCLRRTVDSFEQANGKHANIDQALIANLSSQLAEAINNAPSCISLSPKSKVLWYEINEQLLSQEAPGVMGIIMGRSDSHVLRLAALYCLLDNSRNVLPCHLEAAMALWNYCKESARFIFAESKTGEMAQRVLNVLKTGAKTQTQLHEAFSRHVTAKELAYALTELESKGLARSCRSGAQGKGRPAITWHLGQKADLGNGAKEVPL